ERRAKVINAEGEYQAAERLAEAGRVMAQEPATLQLRFLQTLSEVATEKNSTIVFPVPIDLLKTLTDAVTTAANAIAGRPPGAPARAIEVEGPPAAQERPPAES
ncbi:MAG TPA: slipin family protein, partial [Dehalococcoidia bacterium]|nr:slipin family protein [Dehalococcoidia bacterium]